MDISTMFSRCTAATGSLREAALLYRILYWQSRATVKIDGQLWIAKDRATWLKETGLSRDQYNRARHKLQLLGLIESRQAFFGGRCITHVRFKGGLGLAPVPEEPCSRTATLEYSTGATPECSSSATPIYKEEIEHINITLNEEGVHSHAKSGMIEKVSKTVSEVLKEGKPKNPHKPDTGAYLEHVWKTTVSDETGKTVVPFNVGLKAQFKRVVTLCPQGQADAIARHCVVNWTEFGKAAEEQAGAYKVPTVPSPWFFVKYIEVAINLWQEKTEPIVPVGKKTAAVQSIATPKKASDKASLDDVMSILGGK